MRLLRRPMFVLGLVVLMTVSAACTSGPSAPAATAANTAGLVSTTVAVPAQLAGSPFDEPRQALVPPSWTISVWARVPGARLAVWAPDGSLLISRPGAGEVVRLVPDGAGGATSSSLLTDLTQPHGLAFDGATLYVAESDQLDAYTYANGGASGRRTVVAGLPDAKSSELGGSYAHALKSVAVGPDSSIYFSIGSTSNISANDREAVPQRASIMRVPPGGAAPEVFARGVRNGTGLAIAPDGVPWTAVNNRDNIAYPHDWSFSGGSGSDRGRVIPAYVTDHPVEELARLTPGRDLGWPYCNPDQDPVQPGAAPDFSSPPFVRDVETNPDGDKLDCATLTPIEQSFGAHAAPLGMSIVTAGLPAPYTEGALVGIHGSWNATPPRAPEVSFFPWSNGTFDDQRTLVGGFQSASGSRWGRPVAAVQGPDRAIYITDDSAGAVYRLAPPT